MSNETLFYVCGAALAISAVLTSLAGLRIKDFPGKAAPLVAVWFIVLVGASTTFAVLHAQDEQEAKAAEFSSANKEITKEESSPVEAEGEKAPTPTPKSAAKGEGGTLQLAASPTDLAFDATSLTSKPGKVTIDFDNPAPLEHDVAIEQDGKQIAVSETLAEGKTSVSADLAPGTYTFLCTVPGHAEAGMEGTLTVK
ncbi:MAG: plastocyanin/azurin family copper-binding protein [Solirubrobacterales bacterium]